MKELEKLRQLLNTVMEALSQLATQLPDEFINSPELSGLEFQDLFKDLDEIQKRPHGRRSGRGPGGRSEAPPSALGDDGCPGKGGSPGEHGVFRPTPVGDVPPVG